MIPAPWIERQVAEVVSGRGLQSDRQRLVAMAGRPGGLGLTRKLDLEDGAWNGPVGGCLGGGTCALGALEEKKLAGSGLAFEHYRILQR